jgi:dTMP kinase
VIERGTFIAIEGGDGSGKGTQSEILYNYIKNELGKQALKVSFPRYGKKSAYYVEQYLNGVYGEANEVSADLAALAYAIDRFDSKSEIENHLNIPGGFVVADRYMASNLAHQGTKFTDAAERHLFYDRTLHTEYEILGIPKPTKNIVLLVPTELAQQNVDKKDTRDYTTKKRDIHEADANHLELAKANYEELCRLYPDEFVGIDCIDNDGKMKSIEEIQGEIRQLLVL